MGMCFSFNTHSKFLFWNTHLHTTFLKSGLNNHLCVYMCSCAHECSVLNKQEAEDLLGNHVVFKEENTVVGCSPYNFKSGISHKSFC